MKETVNKVDSVDGIILQGKGEIILVVIHQIYDLGLIIVRGDEVQILNCKVVAAIVTSTLFSEGETNENINVISHGQHVFSEI